MFPLTSFFAKEAQLNSVPRSCWVGVGQGSASWIGGIVLHRFGDKMLFEISAWLALVCSLLPMGLAVCALGEWIKSQGWRSLFNSRMLKKGSIARLSFRSCCYAFHVFSHVHTFSEWFACRFCNSGEVTGKGLELDPTIDILRHLAASCGHDLEMWHQWLHYDQQLHETSAWKRPIHVDL